MCQDLQPEFQITSFFSLRSIFVRCICNTEKPCWTKLSDKKSRTLHSDGVGTCKVTPTRIRELLISWLQSFSRILEPRNFTKISFILLPEIWFSIYRPCLKTKDWKKKILFSSQSTRLKEIISCSISIQISQRKKKIQEINTPFFLKISVQSQQQTTQKAPNFNVSRQNCLIITIISKF